MEGGVRLAREMSLEGVLELMVMKMGMVEERASGLLEILLIWWGIEWVGGTAIYRTLAAFTRDFKGSPSHIWPQELWMKLN